MFATRTVIWIVIAATIALLDQWTKAAASSQLDYGQAVEILPVLNLTLMHNEGAAFSFLNDAGGWQRWFFVGISSLVSVALFVWLTRLKRAELLLAVSLSFILGGALGNLWDRAFLGYVVDFISVHYQNHYFPTFNIADSGISIGAALMILDMFINPEKHKDSSG